MTFARELFSNHQFTQCPFPKTLPSAQEKLVNSHPCYLAGCTSKMKSEVMTACLI